MNREIIQKRCSIRKYKDEVLSDATIAKIKSMIQDTVPLFKDIKYQIDLVYDGKAFRTVLGGVIGSYGKIHAPHYLVASTVDIRDAYENIGYMMEYLVLKLTEMNIGTCWIGGGIKQGLFKDFLSLDADLTPVVVIAFGNPLEETMFRTDSSQFKRKPLKEIASGDYSSYLETMELIRLSPSAANTQPWRYDFVKAHEVDLYRVKNNFLVKKFLKEMNRIDLGISLCHFEIGLHEKNLSFELVDKYKLNKQMIYYKTIVI